jgi:hypothetical protein
MPNRGGRIGHQTNDYFLTVTYCKKNNFNYVYHPFTCNSKKFEEILNFNTLHDLNYNNMVNKIKKIINIKDLIDINTDENNKYENIHKKLIEIHELEEDIMLYDEICGNEKFPTIFNINDDDIIEVKKKYRGCLLKYYENYVKNNYICIHIRCGDIVNDKSRFLNVNYFIDRYHNLILTYPELKEIPVYIVTEQNFNDDDLLYENIINCNIIKSDDIKSFYYIVNCSYLIASRSGFSNLSYILGNMKVVKPPNDLVCYFNSYWDNTIDVI